MYLTYLLKKPLLWNQPVKKVYPNSVGILDFGNILNFSSEIQSRKAIFEENVDCFFEMDKDFCNDKGQDINAI